MSDNTHVNTHLVRWAISSPTRTQQKPTKGPNTENTTIVIMIPTMIPSMSKSPSLRKSNTGLFDESGMTIIVTAKKGQPKPPFL